MSSWLDEQVNTWIKQKFLNDSGQYNPIEHGEPEEIKVLQVDMGWSCCCWSSWTRDDDFEVKAQFEGPNGTFEYTYGTWSDFPKFIQELDEYINNTECYYESKERNPWRDEW